MNRFRELKQRLIKGKRDSQKVQINGSLTGQVLPQQYQPVLFPSNYQLQKWVQNQLQYYGISPSSYRLRQLKYFFDCRDSEGTGTQNVINEEERQMILEQQKELKQLCNEEIQQEEKIVAQQCRKIEQQNKQSLIEPITRGQEQEVKKGDSRVQNTTGHKIIWKRNKNNHSSSLNRMQQTKSSNCRQDQHVGKFLLSCQGTNPSEQVKQLDYYTLILQLTVELNYSRVNKETHNEKSILKQLKNLICYIERESKLNSGSTAQNNTKSPALLSNQKSCHTFSSIHSNGSLMSIHNQDDFGNDSSPKRRRVEGSNPSSQRFSVNSINLTDNKVNNENGGNELFISKTGHKSISSQIDEEEHNQTFKSISIFEEQNELQPQRNYNTDDLNENKQQRQNIILIEESESETNIIIQNTPLSRITQHESQYTISCQPSLKDSPSRSAPGKSNGLENTLFDYQQISSSDSPTDSKHPILNLPPLGAKVVQLKSPSPQDMNDKKHFKKAIGLNNFLPQNELILKKLSDKLQSREQHQNPLQQSLEYKRILYMLDSEYGGCDFKSRTPSRMGPHSPSIPFNQSSSQKSLSLYYIKNSTDLSAKSFNKQVFDSHSQIQNNHHHLPHTNNQRCLMDNLEALFSKRSTNHLPKSPQPLKFNLSNDNNTPLQSQRFQKHQRSKTSLRQQNQGLSKTKKYRLNLLSQLSQQMKEESEQNGYDVNNYQGLKNESEEDSVYHKVSRNSYLTSSTPNSKLTSSESEFESEMSFIKKENLIVKKNRHKSEKDQYFVNQKKTGLIVKKSKKKKNHSDDALNLTQRFTNQNKENFQLDETEFNLSSAQRKQSFYKKQKPSISQHSCRWDNSNLKNDSPCIDIMISSGDSKNQDLPNRDESGESKLSAACPRPIKYKVYTREPRMGGKQDKRKVLEDIVSILNSKYNKNIQLGQ